MPVVHPRFFGHLEFEPSLIPFSSFPLLPRVPYTLFNSRLFPTTFHILSSPHVFFFFRLPLNVSALPRILNLHFSPSPIRISSPSPVYLFLAIDIGIFVLQNHDYFVFLVFLILYIIFFFKFTLDP